MKLIKDSILNKIQLAAEVNGALTEYNLVIVTKHRHHDANPVYAIHGCHGELVAGQIQELGDEGQQQ
ncbi:hypothetical protein ES703_41422 [subsurface metagenome]